MNEEAPKNMSMLFSRIFLLLMGVPLALVFRPTVLFLAAAMLPTAVAALVSRNRHPFGWLTMSGINLAACYPYLFDMWFGSHTVGAAIDKLSDPFILLVLYGSAGLGWIFYLIVPPAVALFVQMSRKQDARDLKAEQKKLVARWGEEVQDTIL